MSKQEEPGYTYLEKKTLETSLLPQIASEVSEEEAANVIEEEDPQALASPSSSWVSREYHIVYSPSYCVPVLYCNAWKQDGHLLTLDELWEQVPPAHQHTLSENKWNFLTQQEHPILGRPFFQLHPCHTSDVMRHCRPHAPYAYLIAWLSAVGPLVGLNIPLQYAHHLRRS